MTSTLLGNLMLGIIFQLLLKESIEGTKRVVGCT
jgi:hypothetical protein